MERRSAPLILDGILETGAHILLFIFWLTAIYEMELEVKVQCRIPHILTRLNHSELGLFIGKSKDACEESYADWLNGIKGLGVEIHSNFFQFGIFRPATKGNL